MNRDEARWDIFIAHAAADAPLAERIYAALAPHARVFLDSRCLLLGGDWDIELRTAQRKSLITVVLVSASTESAYYQREEIAAAIDLARNGGEHRVVPVYVDAAARSSESIHYGLRLKQGITLAGPRGIERLRDALLQLLRLLQLDGESSLPSPAGTGEWTAQSVDYGVHYHRAGTRALWLLVFIHGLRGHPQRSWGELPRLLAAALQLRGAGAIHCDVASFAYPAGLLHAADLDRAAEDLRTYVLETVIRDYRHVSFIVHSCGGLVLKRALVASMRNTRARIEAGPSAADAEIEASPIPRIRQIFNFAVPHSGGRPRTTMVIKAGYHALLPILYPIALGLGVLSRVPRLGRPWKLPQGFHYGYNRISRQLDHEDPGLIELEREYTEQLRYFDARRIPRPINRTTSQKDGTRFVLRGTHPSVKQARTIQDGLVRKLASRIAPHGEMSDLECALSALNESRRRDHGARLVGADPASVVAAPDPRSGLLDRKREGSQRAVLESLLREPPPSVGDDTPLVVVSGEVGTGKSIVLWSYAGILAQRLLDGSGDGTLAIPFPLDSFDDVEGSEDIWPALVRAWSQWMNKLTRSTDFSEHWLMERVSQARCVLILDSVDELVAKHRVTISQFRATIADLRRKHRALGRLSIVVGVRTSEPIHAALEPDASFRLTIQRLSEVDARRLFPGASAVLDAVAAGPERDSMNEILLTPLILAELNARDPGVQVRQLVSRSDIVDLALEALIFKSRLLDFKLRGNDPTRVEDWKNALMITAMLFSWQFKQYKSAVDRGVLTETAVQASSSWKHHEWEDGASAARVQIERAFAILADPELNSALLDRTVLAPAGADGWYRFKHMEWHDHLMGRYAAACIKSGNLRENTRVSFTQSAFRTGGEILRAERWKGIDASLATTIVRQARGEHGQLILGNLGGLMGNSTIPIDEAGMNVFVGGFSALPLTGCFTFLNAVGYKVLARPTDPSWAVWCDGTVRMMQQVQPMYALSGHGSARLIASFSYCYLRRYAAKFGRDCEPAAPWPGVDLTDEQEKQALHQMLAEFHGDGPGTNAVYRNAQFAFIRIQAELMSKPERPISLVHYLLLLCLAVKHDVAEREVVDGLPTVFAEGSEYERIIRQYPLPEVARVFDRCRSIWSATGATAHAAGR